MNKIKGFIAGILGLILVLSLLELFVPSARGITIGVLQILWVPFKEFFMSDWILSTVLFLIGSFALYGTVHISRRAENKMWSVVTGLVSVISYIAMFTKCSGGE